MSEEILKEVKKEIKEFKLDFINHTANIEEHFRIIKGYFERIQNIERAIFERVKLI